VHRLAGSERHRHAEARERDPLRTASPQVHLDLALSSIEEGDVIEGRRIEVTAELAIDDLENVAIEFRGDARAIVVRCFEHGRLLDEIGAEQEMLARPQSSGDLRQKFVGPFRREVADRAAEENDQPPLAVRQRVEVPFVVGDHCVDLEPRIAGQQALCAGTQHGLAHVERVVAWRDAERFCGIEQQSRLARGSAAELDEVSGANEPDDLGRRAAQQPLLGARQIVLRELADAIEQQRAGLIVEMLRRKPLAPGSQAAPHVVGERGVPPRIEDPLQEEAG